MNRIRIYVTAERESVCPELSKYPADGNGPTTLIVLSHGDRGVV